MAGLLGLYAGKCAGRRMRQIWGAFEHMQGQDSHWTLLIHQLLAGQLKLLLRLRLCERHSN